MAVFYTKLWKENKPPLEALREAQLYVYRHPDEIGKLAVDRGLGVSRPVELPPGGAAVKPGSQTAPVRQWAGFVLAGVGDW
jgi:CHAT domain-containing protein